MKLEVARTPDIKLALCVPSQGMWHADFGMSMLQMCAYLGENLFEDGKTRLINVLDKRTSLLPRSRQECLEDAILQDCTHALFIDSDQAFPRDTAHRLLAHKKAVVACNIPVKTLPSFPTARQRGATPFGVPVSSNGNDKAGLEKVWRVGAGVMLIDLAIMEGIEKPWFIVGYDKKVGQHVGEDWHFCDLVHAAGHDIYIDHELSREVRHVGVYSYSHADIPMLDEVHRRMAA